MAIFRNKTHILTPLDKDARNFIDAAGLNTDSNLNVAGAYTAAEARMAVNLFVKGLKNSPRDLGGLNLWQKGKLCYLNIGGTYNTNKLNLFNPVDSNAAFRALYYNVTHTRYGVKFAGNANSCGRTFFYPGSVAGLASNNWQFSIYSSTNDTMNLDSETVFGNQDNATGGAQRWAAIQMGNATRHIYFTQSSTANNFYLIPDGNIGYICANTFITETAAQTYCKYGFEDRTGFLVGTWNNQIIFSEMAMGGLGFNVFDNTTQNPTNKTFGYVDITMGLTREQVIYKANLVNQLMSTLKRNPFYF